MGEMKERMLRGELYVADDPDIQADAARAHDLMERFNATRASEQELRDRLLRELLGEVGDGVVVRPPLWIDYGTHISIGARTFVNYDCVMLDVAPIRIGAACQLATRVQLLTATHPIDPEPRRARLGGGGADHDRGQRLARGRRDRVPRRHDRREHRRRRRRGRDARPARGSGGGGIAGEGAPRDRPRGRGRRSRLGAP